eukprot:4083426-Heterocapsa_arctica.AAC.1
MRDGIVETIHSALAVDVELKRRRGDYRGNHDSIVFAISGDLLWGLWHRYMAIGSSNRVAETIDLHHRPPCPAKANELVELTRAIEEKGA